jgi:hypothetical protein
MVLAALENQRQITLEGIIPIPFCATVGTAKVRFCHDSEFR